MLAELDRIYNLLPKNGRAAVIVDWATINQNNTAVRVDHAGTYGENVAARGTCPIWLDNGGTGANGFGILDRKATPPVWAFPDIAAALSSGATAGAAKNPMRTSESTCILVTLLTFSVGACSTSEGSAGFSPTSTTPSNSVGSAGSSGSIAKDARGSGGTTAIGLDATGTGAATNSTEVVACTEGVDCTCPTLNVAVIGKPGKWGANPGGDSDSALQSWLNSSSVGTAKADVYPTKPTLTAEFLKPYNVIILASLSDDSNNGPFWSFDSAEVEAFQDWVENQGGGVITLTGYSGNSGEVIPTNQLIAFSGISYASDGLYASCVAPDYRVCGCSGSSTLADWNKTDPLVADLSKGVTWVGLQNGHVINAPADAHVVATVPSPTRNALVGKVTGKGRVLVYGDEWITYTSQWTGEGIVDPNCVGTAFMPQNNYQTAQFWYNLIKWSQPSATCFKIVVKDQPVIL